MRLQAQRAQGSLTPTRLYLIRHGQVADGHTDRYHGHNDIPLSPAGVAQLKRVAAQLKDIPLAGVYASDLTRSIQGAEFICQGRGLTPQIVPEFREINFGLWEGLNFTEIAEQHPEALQARFQDLANFRIPGGESLMDVSRRVLPRLLELVQKHRDQSLARVAHAGVHRVILCDALGLALEHLFRLDQSYGGLSIIDYFPDLAVVRLLNGGVNGIG